MNSADCWIWDDTEIVDSDFLYRRIKRVPDVIMLDQLTGTAVLQPNAFIYDEGSGVSLSIGSIAEGAGMPIVALTKWETHSLAYFTVEVARSEISGVVPEPEDDNAAHGLIRVEATEKRRRREQWVPVRSRLIENSLYVAKEEDVAGTPTVPKCVIS